MIYNCARNKNIRKNVHFIVTIHFFSDFSNLSAFFGAIQKNYNLLFLFVNVFVHINAILHGKDDKVIFRCDIKPQK